ncbi:ubiquitin-conjugating enzyme E2 S [Angomonas deanei]|uniref:E2 ubiquitin-conjugating enzyme n=1 Tax=Angomonas deanei TaxID=59799 RepID=S9WWB3_9TRYP|nr:ubiquitin-conjugating enzyme E2 S [Angomonas deanei]EPY41280.1 ubiquitin-conjugating enzyme E2 S [Angomonas deanei]EPY43806.1 ubiquitin-conjugating enzyme E2 S [Angomonas deanei]CAD2221434.1 Ubiquitin-conjugating enzyme, putative [Angomonas deanei]|eukprot:EPY29113.1 ubiquitin-conjugating enzyme E2 S [Angomonas deanei]
MTLNAHGMRVVMRQMQEIDANPIADVHMAPTEDLRELHFEIDGPEGTPYEAGRFAGVLVFEESYPDVPPKGYFRTRIFHPNVSEKGDICVNALKKDWKPDMGLRHVLQVIRCLLVEPNPESALNEEAGRLLLEDYVTFEKKAAMLTRIHSLRPAGASRFVGGEVAKEEEANTENGAVSQAATTASSGAGLRNMGDSNVNAVASTAVKKEEDKNKKKAADKKKSALKRI